jgi:hypothetical protein
MHGDTFTITTTGAPDVQSLPRDNRMWLVVHPLPCACSSWVTSERVDFVVWAARLHAPLEDEDHAHARCTLHTHSPQQ